MSSVPEELDFVVQLPTDEVIINRRTVQYQSPAASHSATDNPTITLEIPGTGFADLSTLGLFADLKYIATATTAAETISKYVQNGNKIGYTVQGAGGVQLDNRHPGPNYPRLPSTYDLVRSFKIRTIGGVELERVDNMAELAELLHSASANKEWLATSASASNAHPDWYKRGYNRSTTNIPSNGAQIVTSARNVDLGCHKVSGFLTSMGKYIDLAALGGLIIEIDLKPNTECFAATTAHTGGSYSYELTKVKVRCDIVDPSPEYMVEYNRELSQGYSLVYPTFKHTRQHVSTGVNQEVQLNVKCDAARSLYSVVRYQHNVSRVTAADDEGVNHANGYAFRSAGFTWYQYQIGGKAVPSVRVEGYPQAYEMMERTTQVHRNTKHSNITMEQFETDFLMPKDNLDIPPGDQEPGSRLNGKFSMCLDLEQAMSSNLSGVPLTARGDSLKFNFDQTGGQTSENMIVDTWVECWHKASVSRVGVVVRS